MKRKSSTSRSPGMGETAGICTLCGHGGMLLLGVCGCCRSQINSRLFASYAYGRCPTCGRPLLHQDARCVHPDTPLYIAPLAFYTQPIQFLIMRYKKKGIPSLAPYIASLYLPLLWTGKPVAVVPVPCSSKGLRIRGWDQMVLIADILQKKEQIDAFSLLRRSGQSEQKNLNRNQRLQETERSVALQSNAVSFGRYISVRYDHVAVLDDVMTTGATMRWSINLIQTIVTVPVFGICLAMD